MSVQVNKPVKVSFKVSPSIRIVAPQYAMPHIKTTKCDWGKIFGNRLAQQYSDMEIKRTKTGNREVFTITLKGRPTRRADVLVRVQEFLRRNPSMKLSDFQLA